MCQSGVKPFENWTTVTSIQAKMNLVLKYRCKVRSLVRKCTKNVVGLSGVCIIFRPMYAIIAL